MEIQTQQRNKSPEIYPKEMGICELSVKEFKITNIKMFNEVKENEERKLNEIRKTVHEEIKILTRNRNSKIERREIVDLNNNN